MVNHEDDERCRCGDALRVLVEAGGANGVRAWARWKCQCGSVAGCSGEDVAEVLDGVGEHHLVGEDDLVAAVAAACGGCPSEDLW